MAKPKRGRSRIYWRETGGALRAYADFRDYAAEGGKRERLVPPGAKLATTDPAEAEALAAKRLGELVAKRKKAEVLGDLGIRRAAALQAFAAHHLRVKAQSGRVTDQWMHVSEHQLHTAVQFFGPTRELHSIGVSDVQRYAAWLARLPVRRGKDPKEGEPPKKTLSAGSVRHHLNTLSNLFQRAQGEGVVPPGHNPVAALMEKPTAARREAAWLEIPDAALLLSARTYGLRRDDLALPFLYPLLATFLLTGGRESEVLGLEVDDVSFDRKTVTFRPHAHRRLKTATSFRTVPLWPQLEEILREHLYGGESPKVSGLLFPSPRPARKKKGEAETERVVPEPERMLTDWRKSLDAVAERAGWKAGEIRSKMFRHTYCAARLQTLDQGAPVSVYTVAKELGHGGDSMVKRVYGHLGTVRHRAEVVEFRAGNHLDVKGFAERLRSLAG